MMKFKHWETQSGSDRPYRQVTVLNDGNRYKTMVHRGSLLSQFSQIIGTSNLAYMPIYKRRESDDRFHIPALVVFNQRKWRSSPCIVIELHERMDETEMVAIFRSEFIPHLCHTKQKTTSLTQKEFADEVLHKFEQRAETVLEHQQRYLSK